jgi:hypothetical protein
MNALTTEESEAIKQMGVREIMQELNKGYDSYFRLLGKIADGDETLATLTILEKIKLENQLRDARLHKAYQAMLQKDKMIANVLGIRVPELI